VPRRSIWDCSIEAEDCHPGLNLEGVNRASPCQGECPTGELWSNWVQEGPAGQPSRELSQRKLDWFVRGAITKYFSQLQKFNYLSQFWRLEP
jgi:hypothetical protein